MTDVDRPERQAEDREDADTEARAPERAAEKDDRPGGGDSTASEPPIAWSAR